MKNTRSDGGMTRRDVIRRALTLAGAATLLGSGTLLAACSERAPRTEAARATGFTDAEIAWLDEVAETILPETETPGAKAAEIGAFLALMVTDTYDPDGQRRFRDGMRALEAECEQAFGGGFLTIRPSQRLSLLERLDREQHAAFQVAAPDEPPHYFRVIKELTLLGYFTSEIGYTLALRYVESPGRFEPCLDYTPGERAWARHA